MKVADEPIAGPDRIYQILLIEDSHGDVRLYKEVLRAARPDLIFLDLNSPKMDGFEVLRCIRKDEDAAIRAIPSLLSRHRRLRPTFGKHMSVAQTSS